MKLDAFQQYVNQHLNIVLEKEQIEAFATYLNMLKEWNNLFNLTAIVDDEQIVEKHFLDSLIPLKYVSLIDKKVIDIGTGAGFPGMAIAIALPEVKMTLLEPNNKKIRFLTAVKDKLQLKNATIISGRAETENELRERYDVAIARAVKQLNILLELSTPLLKVKGFFIAMKSSSVNEEIALSKKALNVLKCTIQAIHQDILPTEKDERVSVIIVKNDTTPNRYPRPYHLISAKPL
ncbi:MAG: 16S rRNA (guanine(527)-N(7))-methyltransferase RsmG [Bacilli bacterium]|jgi:16S rRNA (guanine527-N7)-methyltransferase|nr:16S rRNA (guanine(527)-N(7))-methyltransferase RsmG [Bacilli bacterium]MDD4005797.1 16S rRNA (guanine(527)-N(7))-methyltransferase RsmG [Bacilli bacterium]